MIAFLVTALSIAYFVYSYLHTDWVEEYCALFRVHQWSNLLYFRDYTKHFITSVNNELTIHNFRSYISHYRNNFVTRLLLCPYCSIFWMSIIAAVLLKMASSALALAFATQFFYKIMLKLEQLTGK